MGETSVDVDEEHNRIYLELSGNFESEEASTFAEKRLRRVVRIMPLARTS